MGRRLDLRPGHRSPTGTPAIRGHERRQYLGQSYPPGLADDPNPDLYKEAGIATARILF